MSDKIQAEKPVLSIKETEQNEILYTTLECEHTGCTEVLRIAFSTLDDKGKPKKDKKEKVKKDYYDTIDAKQMPDKDNPGIWYCEKHAT
jgi:hypothetical protein